MLKKYKKALLLILCLASQLLIAQSTLINIHSHNDYLQNVPFWNAYTNGANSIEIDVFFKASTLYVAHSEEDIAKNKTIEALYLKPLVSAINLKIGGFQEFYIMVDIKSEAKSTLNALIKVLNDYPEVINHPKIKIIISGNRPDAENYTDYPSFIQFDYQELDKELSLNALKKVALISVDFKKYSEWNGKGRLTHIDKNQVEAVIKKAHNTGKPFRFWGTPDSKTAWKAFVDMGVNFINTDIPYKCKTYVSALPKQVITTTNFSEVYTPNLKNDGKQAPVKNIILLIGDGNGLSQISSAVLANNGALSLTQLKNIGLIKTQSADDFTTDSAAAGTALATGKKTNNRAIGTDSKGVPLANIVEILHKRGFSTGCITTDQITGATPASFYAHQKDRSDKNGIISDFINCKLDLFVAGGAAGFKNSILNKKFKLLPSIEDLENTNQDRVGVFIAEEDVPSVLKGRGDLLAKATKKGLQFLKQKNKPFFVMIEAAQIDSFGHYNDVAGIVSETIDFDKAISEALKFADKNPETLVIITADHETSGFSIPQGNLKQHEIEGDFTTHDHTGVMVPIFAYGAQSNLFNGVYDNTEVFHKIMKILSVDKL